MGIYEPEEDSYLLEAEVKKYARGRVLDMGTGSGIQARAAAARWQVREVVAVDISKDAVSALNKMTIAKVKANKSDLFQSVKGRFDTIIFNPPYLPNDKDDHDIALDGGKVGHELIAKFLLAAKSHLERNGFILLLYSSRTGDVDRIIKGQGYACEALLEKSLPFFEKLHVVKLTAPTGSVPFAVGKRGLIYKEDNMCVKEKNPDSAVDSLANEAEFLKAANEKGIGPKLILFDGKKLKRDFVEGTPLGEFIDHADRSQITDVFIKILAQCRELDKLKINKTELTNPYKDILVTAESQPVMIDFERCRKSEKPQNVTQFLQYVMRRKATLSSKGIDILDDWIMLKAKKYKDFFDDRAFAEVLELFSQPE